MTALRARTIAFVDTLAMALATLGANPLRPLLTLLGIVIGAGTVVSIMSFTEGLRLKVTTEMSMLGAGAFQVQKWPHMTFGDVDWRKYEKRRDLTRDQGEALRSLPHVSKVSIEAYHRGRERIWTSEPATRPNVTVAGAVPDYEPANGVTIAEGRFFSDVDVDLGRRVAVVGADVADVLHPGQSANAIVAPSGDDDARELSRELAMRRFGALSGSPWFPTGSDQISDFAT